jgi:cytochrome c peroxidase
MAQLTSPLAAQALFPLVNPVEMQGDFLSTAPSFTIWSSLAGRVTSISPYLQMLKAAYPNTSSFNIGHIVRAIAAYDTAAFTTVNTPLDSYLQGNSNALSPAAKRGARLFLGTAQCVKCHQGAFLSDQKFHALAMPQLGPGEIDINDDRGRFLKSNNPLDTYTFRTSPLRNVCLQTAFSHAGGYTSLTGVVAHHLDPVSAVKNYDSTQLESTPVDYQSAVDTNDIRRQARIQSLDPLVQSPISLTPDEMQDLVTFLCDGLTDPAAKSPAGIALPPPSVPSGLTIED